VFDSSRYDNKLAFLNPLVPVPKLHPEAAFDNEEHFIFLFMMMEYELALQLIELHMLPIEFGSDVWLPVFGNLRELLGDVDFVHKAPSLRFIVTGMVAKNPPSAAELTIANAVYIIVYTMPKTAKLFRNGRSQAVRLPSEYRFAGSEVYVRRDPATGDVILSRRPDSWTDFFDLIKSIEVPKDFLADRKDAPPQKRRLF
jgi:antitoxin VapB